MLCRSLARPRLALGCCQLLLAGAIAWTAYSLSASLPYWPIDPSISSNIWFNFQLDLARAFWALLPPTLLWGASFPLALARRIASRIVQFARIYAANTLGAIIGALGASLLLVAWVGSQRTEQVLIALSILSGLLLLPRRWFVASARCAFDLHRPAPLESAGRLRPLRRELGRQGRHHLHGRRPELIGRRLEFPERSPDLSRRRQDPGVERSARHAAPAHAGTPHDSDRGQSSLGPGHRLRRGHHGGRGVHRSKSANARPSSKSNP